MIPVEKLYYCARYDACCCHCGLKKNLSQISIAIQFALCVNVKTRNK